MNTIKLGSKYASIVWMESKRVCVDGNRYSFSEVDMVQQLAKAVAQLPLKQTCWIVDDTLVPTLLLHGIVEIPVDAETRNAFFCWRYSQSLGLDSSQIIQALNLEKDVWLLFGIPQQQFDIWTQSAKMASHSIRKLIPRWVWLYNRLAPTREVPGMLLSLSASDDELFTGTLAAWKGNLVLLRQWTDPVSIETWNAERVLPTIAYLQREKCSPQELCVWGSDYWPDCGICTQIIQPEIPTREAI